MLIQATWNLEGTQDSETCYSIRAALCGADTTIGPIVQVHHNAELQEFFCVMLSGNRKAQVDSIPICTYHSEEKDLQSAWIAEMASNAQVTARDFDSFIASRRKKLVQEAWMQAKKEALKQLTLFLQGEKSIFDREESL